MAEPNAPRQLNPMDFLRIPSDEPELFMNMMTDCKFFDKDDKKISFYIWSSSSTELPENVAKIEVNGGDTVLNVEDCRKLTRLLNNRSKKLEEISLEAIYDSSPEYLALLIAICNSCKVASFSGCLHGDHNFGCLSASLLREDGLKGLVIHGESYESLTFSNAILLFRGIKVAPCLESLKISMHFEEMEEGVESMLAASLRGNSHIKDLEIVLLAPTLCQEFFQSVIAERKTRSLELELPRDHNASVDAFAEALSSSECSVRDLTVKGGLTNWFQNTNGPAAEKQNKSVKDLMLTKTRLLPPQLLKVVNMFQSLVLLDLTSNNLSDLSGLDHLLLGEGACLESLILARNDIDVSSLQTFASKLPRMKCLRNLELQGNPFITSTSFSLDSLEKSFWENTSLERFTLLYRGTTIFTKRELALVLNRCGRGNLQKDPQMPPKLWPLVLHRTQTISLVPKKDKRGQPEWSIGPDALKVEALYWLVRERAVYSWGSQL